MKREIHQSGSYQKDKRNSEGMTINRYREEISADELVNYELSWFRGEIIVVDDLKTFIRVLPRISKKKILGFDTETRPSFRRARKNKFLSYSWQHLIWLVFS